MTDRHNCDPAPGMDLPLYQNTAPKSCGPFSILHTKFISLPVLTYKSVGPRMIALNSEKDRKCGTLFSRTCNARRFTCSRMENETNHRSSKLASRRSRSRSTTYTVMIGITEALPRVVNENESNGVRRCSSENMKMKERAAIKKERLRQWRRKGEMKITIRL